LKGENKMKLLKYSIFGLIILSLVFAAGNSFSQALKGVPGEGGVFKSYSEQFGGSFTASAMIHCELRTPEGHYVAEIIDLVIDPANGRVSDVVITRIRGMGAEKVAIPFSSVARNGANIFVYNAPEDAYRFHGMTPYWSEGFYQYSKHEESMGSYRTSKLIGVMARSHQGEDLGLIDDLRIDPADGRVVSLGVSRSGGKPVAVPFGALSRSGEEAFVLNTTVKALDAAPAF
jgi:sporulation protein YlmC with PRC-barrel domain